MHFESMIRAVSARLAESQRMDEEPFLLGCVLDRQHGYVESAQRDVRADFVGRPARPRVVRVFVDLEEQTGRVPGAEVLLSEPPLNRSEFYVLTIQGCHPERRQAI